MTKRLVGIALLLGAVACGDDGGGPAVIDAPQADAPASIDAPMLPTTCDPVDQATCPTGYKCTIVEEALLVHRCVPASGTVAEGGACTGFGGTDACAAGLMCLDDRCQRFCGVTTDCGANQGCAYFRNGDGFCKDTCAPFDATCPAGWACTFMSERVTAPPGRTIAGCRPVGTVMAGAQCLNDFPFQNCAANHLCSGATTPVCRPLCDPAHPCASGTCTLPPTIVSNPTQAGACF